VSVFSRKAGDHSVDARRNLLLEREVKLPGSCNVDGSEFSGPGIDVLEDVAVDCLKMRGVELATKGLFFQLPDSATCCSGFKRG
jgi:hypothetical protein